MQPLASGVSCLALSLVAALATLPGSGMQAAQPPPFKNVQVLTDLAQEDLRAAMSVIAGSLGVTCEHCHVNPWDSDAKPAKRTAREMLAMVRSLNAASFGGRPAVSCETCHRGSLHPRSTPDTANAAWRSSNAPAPPAPVPPAAPRIVGRFLRQSGLDREDTPRQLVGQGIARNGMGADRPFRFEIVVADGGRFRDVDQWPQSTTVTVMNGADGWVKSGPAEARPMSASDRDETLRSLEVFRILDVRLTHVASGVEVEALGGQPAYLVRGTGPTGRAERLWFSVASGLLLARETELSTPLGAMPERAEYAEYRRVGRLRLPFRITLAGVAEGQMLRVERIEIGTRLEPALFARPR